MPAPIVLSSVISSRVLLGGCLAGGAATVIVVAAPFALLTQPPWHAGQPHSRTAIHRDRALTSLRTTRSCPGETPAGRLQAARKERLRCHA
jgi:hypothetical protein